MSRSLRLSEKWFRRGLWLVALVFAWFLIGLGSAVVRDLPRVETTRTLQDFLPQPQTGQLRERIDQARRAEADAKAALEQAQLRHQVAASDVAAARETFQNWLATRRATQLAGQDPQLLERTEALDRLRAAEREALAAVQAQQQALLDARQAAQREREALGALERQAGEQLAAEQRRAELRIFGLRLALTLPLLALAGWLFVKKRQGPWWPFVWGYVFFALFVFFVELVPYLPSYGGYVRYGVGVLVTVLVGRWAIVALNRYLERQRQAEQLPDAQRREGLAYDTALGRLAKGVCPGCERPVDLRNETIDYCPHCGIGLHRRCGACNTRKSAFARYCHACGTAA